jgi:hypothetical protein
MNNNNLEVFMKTKSKLAITILAVLVLGLALSCTSTGEYMPSSRDEVVIGTVQATFVARSSVFFWKSKSGMDAVNKQAYINLLEAANQKYPGNVDIRDIVWVTGKAVSNEYTEVSASGKVVQMR